MAEIRRMNLNFNLGVPLYKEAWELLNAVPVGHRTATICHALLEQRQNDRMRSTLKEVVQAELKNIHMEEPEDTQDDAVLGFLRALQGDDEP